ncbi:AraC family transcriptional regulator [Salinisphaera sp. T31B1]|uniref:AraC family transcriptional regulator n=1 Tax=Salinisphaera sp. T31B1 TaxID=727963 RepID=UPI003341D608
MDRLSILNEQRLVDWPWGDDALSADRTKLPDADAFRLEDARSYAPMPTVAHAQWPRMHISLIVDGRFSTAYRTGLSLRRFDLGRGSIFIYPAGCELADIRPTGDFRMLLVEIGGPLLQQLAQERDSPTTDDIQPQHDIRDPGLARLVRAMESDVRRRRPIGRLYSEYLSLALASYVMGRYGIRHEPDTRAPVLSALQRTRVREYIHDHLERGLSTVELARVAQLSPRHFSRLFRASFGESPHQYVLRLRLERARTLLSSGSTAISDVALAVGCGSQSYFTDLFRRATGITPRQYRLQHRPQSRCTARQSCRGEPG